MNWKEKIKEGLKLIKKGCASQDSWNKCYECPFYDYCTTLEENGSVVPNEWELEADE